MGIFEVEKTFHGNVFFLERIFFFFPKIFFEKKKSFFPKIFLRKKIFFSPRFF